MSDTLPDPVEQLLQEFNAQHAVVNDAGRTLAYSWPPGAHVAAFTRSRIADFRERFGNRFLTLPGTTRPQPVADVWLKHPRRRQYLGGVVFDPCSKHRSDQLNLWGGFAVTPRPGSWAQMRAHIRDGICSGNERAFDYQLCWMARLVQRPECQGEVAVVLKGKQGTGKGFLARALAHLFGPHAQQVSQAQQVVGRFNEHLRHCVLLFADEAFFAGDKQHVGELKRLITEPTLSIEVKCGPVFQTKNHLHLMMASNEEWVVPAGMDDRRFFVLEVGDTHVNDHAYFRALQDELDAGGYEAMLFDLLHTDISAFNVRAIPQTAALQEQKMRSLDVDHAWWLDVLERGFVFQSRLGLEHHFGKWYETVSTGLLFESYEIYARAHGHRRPLNRVTFGKFLARLGGRKRNLTRASVGETARRDGSSIEHAVVWRHQVPGYHFGTLDDARAAFGKATGLILDWAGAEEPPLETNEDGRAYRRKPATDLTAYRNRARQGA